MTVTIDGLKQIYTSSLTDEQLGIALDTANLVVNETVRPNSNMSNARYDKITLYLAAHFASITSSGSSGSVTGGAIRRSKLGEADESYAVPDGTMYAYNTTYWGQLAIALDDSGTLSNINARKSLPAQFRIVGS